MSCTVEMLGAAMARWAPLHWAEEWDNVGLLVGTPAAAVDRVLVALEVTDEVLAEALTWPAELLVVHHPPIFRPLRRIDLTMAAGERLRQMLVGGLAVYAAHTNLDVAPGGTNDLLAAAFDLAQPEVLQPSAAVTAATVAAGQRGHGRIGNLAAPMSLARLCRLTRERLAAPGLRLVGDPATVVQRVAVGAGAGADLIAKAARLGAQVLITGDVSHHQAQDAADLGLAVIDPGHFATEALVVPQIVSYLQGAVAEARAVVAVQAATAGRPPFAFL